MTRTEFLVERNKRRKEIRDNIRFLIVVLILLLGGIIPFICKMDEIKADSAETWIDEEYVEYINEVCAEKNLCPELVIAIVEAESSGQADVVSDNGRCQGLMQLDSRFHEGNLFDWKHNIDLGTDDLVLLFEKYGDLPAVLTAYNTGQNSDATKSAISSGVGNKYAKKIMKRSEELERLHGK